MYKRLVASMLLGSMLALSLSGTAAANARFLLGFAESYTVPDGTVRVHRGLDLAAPAGGPVEVPLSGEVSFVGSVPGSHGDTVLAVTVVDGDRKLTFMPLDRASVEKGQQVSRGDVLGTVAALGDPSSDEAHVHVGLRKDGVYVDPSALFDEPVEAAPAPAAPDGGAPTSGGTGVEPRQAPVTGASAAAPVVAVAPVVSSAAAAEAPLTVSTGATGAQPIQDGSSGVQLARGVSVASPGAVGAQGAGSAGALGASAGSAPLAGMQGLWSTVADAAAGVASQPVGVASCLAAFVGCVALFTRRALVRRLISEEPVSDRLGNMLRALRAGDTLCGLTSCSGHSAFTDPGPL